MKGGKSKSDKGHFKLLCYVVFEGSADKAESGFTSVLWVVGHADAVNAVVNFPENVEYVHCVNVRTGKHLEKATLKAVVSFFFYWYWPW